MIQEKGGHIINFPTLMAKFYIYRAKCSETELNIHQFIAEIDVIQQMELQIAINNDKLNRHCKKWRDFQNEP